MDRTELIAALHDLDAELAEPVDVVRTLVAIMDNVASFRPDWAQRMRYFLEELGWLT